MSWDGSGTFTRQYGSAGWVNDRNAGTKILATRHDTNDDDLATGINNCLAKDGQNAATADLDIGSFRLTNVADGTTSDDAATLGQVQGGTPTLLTGVAGTDTITAGCTPALTAYNSGQLFKFIPASTNTGAATLNISGLGAKSVTKFGTTPLAAGDLAATEVHLVVYDGTQFQLINPAQAAVPIDCFGRLTLTSGTAVTTSDVTAATTLYFTPYKGSTISIYDGSSAWVKVTFSEVSIAVPASTSQMYDVFGYLSSGALALELTAWTNDTTRATALTLQNGAYVKSGATTRRYLGSFRTTTVSGQTEDSATKRYVWNMYNRVSRKMLRQESTANWTYNNSTIRQANNSTSNQLDFVVGVSEDAVTANIQTEASNTAGGAGTAVYVAIGLDSTTTRATDSLSSRFTLATANASCTFVASYNGFPGAGRHTLVWLESTNATANNTFVGDNTGSTKSGIMGVLLG